MWQDMNRWLFIILIAICICYFQYNFPVPTPRGLIWSGHSYLYQWCDCWQLRRLPSSLWQPFSDWQRRRFSFQQEVQQSQEWNWPGESCISKLLWIVTNFIVANVLKHNPPLLMIHCGMLRLLWLVLGFVDWTAHYDEQHTMSGSLRII